MRMKAPVPKVDCSKGGEEESSFGGNGGAPVTDLKVAGFGEESEGGIPPVVFASLGMLLRWLKLRDSRFGKCERVWK